MNLNKDALTNTHWTLFNNNNNQVPTTLYIFNINTLPCIYKPYVYDGAESDYTETTTITMEWRRTNRT